MEHDLTSFEQLFVVKFEVLVGSWHFKVTLYQLFQGVDVLVGPHNIRNINTRAFVSSFS